MTRRQLLKLLAKDGLCHRALVWADRALTTGIVKPHERQALEVLQTAMRNDSGPDEPRIYVCAAVDGHDLNTTAKLPEPAKRRKE